MVEYWNRVKIPEQKWKTKKTLVKKELKFKTSLIRTGNRVQLSSLKIRQDCQTSANLENLKMSVEKPIVKPYVSPLLFSQRQKSNNTDKQFVQFLNMFKKLHINISFTEVLA